MIPVNPQSPPSDFNSKVRNPGQRFLRTFPGRPSDNDYGRNKAKYWVLALDQLYFKYNKICAYSAELIFSTKKKRQHSVDHFIPKSKDIDLSFVYEWSNFRLCLKQINNFKDSDFVIDPFKIKYDWFIIDFEVNRIKPNTGLDPILRLEIINTIRILDLNNIIFQNKRTAWIDRYYKGITDLNGLQQKAPFIRYEIVRQGYEEKVKEIHERYLRGIGIL